MRNLFDWHLVEFGLTWPTSLLAWPWTALSSNFFFPNTTSPSRRCWTLGWPRRWRGLVAIKTTSPSRGCRTLGWPSRPWPRCRQFFKTTSPSRGCWTLGWPRWPLKTGRCLWRAVLACHHLIGANAPARTLALTSLKAAPAPWRGFFDLGLSHLCYLDLKVLIFYTYIHEQAEWRSG